MYVERIAVWEQWLQYGDRYDSDSGKSITNYVDNNDNAIDKCDDANDKEWWW